MPDFEAFEYFIFGKIGVSSKIGDLAGYSSYQYSPYLHYSYYIDKILYGR
jgi:hypothetical protein